MSTTLRTALELLHRPIGIGDNLPTPESIEATLASDHRELADRRNLLLEKAKVAPSIDNDEAERQVTQFLAQIGACVSKAKAAHKIEKAPHLEAGRTVDRFFLEGFERALEGAAAPLRKALGSYKLAKEQRARRAAEEESRRRQEEADRLAATAKTDEDLDAAIVQEQAAQQAAVVAQAPAQELTRARGDVAGLSTLRMVVGFRVLDIATVPRRYLTLDEPAVLRAIKAGETIPGIEKTETPDVRISR